MTFNHVVKSDAFDMRKLQMKRELRELQAGQTFNIGGASLSPEAGKDDDL